MSVGGGLPTREEASRAVAPLASTRRPLPASPGALAICPFLPGGEGPTPTSLCPPQDGPGPVLPSPTLPCREPPSPEIKGSSGHRCPAGRGTWELRPVGPHMTPQVGTRGAQPCPRPTLKAGSAPWRDVTGRRVSHPRAPSAGSPGRLGAPAAACVRRVVFMRLLLWKHLGH